MPAACSRFTVEESGVSHETLTCKPTPVAPGASVLLLALFIYVGVRLSVGTKVMTQRLLKSGPLLRLSSALARSNSIHPQDRSNDDGARPESQRSGGRRSGAGSGTRRDGPN
jgi:hypothetical protein